MSALVRILQAGPGVSAAVLGLYRMPGSYAGRKSNLAINDVVLDTLTNLDGKLRSRRVVVATALGSGLPAVKADRAQIRQALSILIENAMEAMDDVASRARLLRIRTERHARGILVTVADSGRGIDPRASDRMFEPTYTTKPKNAGLGLPICRSIIVAHGGRVWARPGETCGAVLQVILPGAPSSGDANDPNA